MKNSEIKALAKARMKANQTTIILIVILTSLISLLQNGELLFLNIISIILSPFVTYVIAKLSLYNHENLSLSDAYKNFNFKYWLKVFVANLIIGIPSFIFWIVFTSLLLGLGMSFVLPSTGLIDDTMMITIFGGTIFVIILLVIIQLVVSILLELFFGLSKFIALDNEELNIIQTLKKSFNFMKGHKKELFFLELSFILWFLGIGILNYVMLYIPFINIFTTIITGILSAYVIVYIDFSVGEFYKHITCKEDIFNHETIEVEII